MAPVVTPRALWDDHLGLRSKSLWRQFRWRSLLGFSPLTSAEDLSWCFVVPRVLGHSGYCMVPGMPNIPSWRTPNW
ncbi:hypothetical protein DAEQUDRAFT_441194 [Daedalea quercina L-15889]|uniref:Uncharacterized protein n=1 Tax=Daedalea quercina L-15889 TaxID=1314783 RepID=A0A165NC91_9APHY|nr:hypothetical protein DAEQUDRAFT_441194 [Daedalea quercina L-15889]